MQLCQVALQPLQHKNMYFTYVTIQPTSVHHLRLDSVAWHLTGQFSHMLPGPSASSVAPKQPAFWKKLRIMHIEIQFCIFSAYPLYFFLAFGARCSIVALQFQRFLFPGFCRKGSCSAYLQSMSTMALSWESGRQVKIETSHHPWETRSNPFHSWHDAGLTRHSTAFVFRTLPFWLSFCEAFKAASAVPWSPLSGSAISLPLTKSLSECTGHGIGLKGSSTGLAIAHGVVQP